MGFRKQELGAIGAQASTIATRNGGTIGKDEEVHLWPVDAAKKRPSPLKARIRIGVGNLDVGVFQARLR